MIERAFVTLDQGQMHIRRQPGDGDVRQGAIMDRGGAVVSAVK